MYYDFRVEIPNVRGKIYFKKIKESTYVNYEYDRVYKKEKKYNVPKRTTIGKQCSDDEKMMYPNPNFMKYFPDVELPADEGRTDRSSCLRIGAYMIIQKVVSDALLDRILDGIYNNDERGSRLFLDLAAYSIITENNAGQYYPDYAYNHPLFTAGHSIYSDATVSEFIRQISINDSVRFQNEWNSIKDHREKIYISYDSTNKNCRAGDIDIVEFGHAKDDKGEPVFNYSIAYDTHNREPLFYEEYPGSIVDVSQLQLMLDKAKSYGYRHAGFILDRGYFSRENIRFMDRCGYDFVIMIKGMKDLVSGSVLETKGSFENSRRHSIGDYNANGTTIKRKVFLSDEKDRYVHVYFSADRCAAERNILQAKLDRMEYTLGKLEGKPVTIEKVYEKYFHIEYYHESKEDQCFVCAIPKENAIERELQLCGYFCILTSEEMSAREALELYRSRDGSEKLFRADKTFLGNRSLRVHSSEALDGKMLIEFVALIIRNRIHTAIKTELKELLNKPNFMNVPAAIRELEKIELIRQADGVYRLDHAITANQKTILKAFGMDAVYVKKKAKELSDRLRPGTTTVKI